MHKYGFNNFLKMTRETKGVTLAALCQGLCDVTMLERIEKGERSIDRMIRDRIVSRLGVSGEDFEDYVQASEYKIYEAQTKLISAVEAENISEAELLRDGFARITKPSQKIQLQFLADMDARILAMKSEDKEKCRSLYLKAIQYTIPEFAIESVRKMILSPQEYYLLIRYLDLWPSCTKDEGRKERNEINEWFRMIIKHIKNAKHEPLCKAKVLPMAVVSFYKFIKEGDEEYLFDEVFEASETALNYLRNSRRIYYAIPLLSLRRDIMKKHFNDNEDIRLRMEREQKWKDAIKYMYDYWNVSSYMDNSCYIYKDSSVLRIGDVVRRRREMLGLSQTELADGICDVRTVTRLEAGKTGIQKAIAIALMEKLGINADFRRTRILTNDYIVLDEFYDLSNNMNDEKPALLRILFDRLALKIDLNIKENRQTMKFYDTSILFKESKIDADQYRDGIKDALAETLFAENFLQTGNGFLSNTELLCIYNLLILTLDKKEDENIFLTVLDSNYSENGKYCVKNSLGELFLLGMSNKYGSMGKFDKSDDLSRVVSVWALQNCRASSAHESLYNTIWNVAVMNKDPLNPIFDNIFDICEWASDYLNEGNSKEFYQLTHKKYQNKEKDWIE